MIFSPGENCIADEKAKELTRHRSGTSLNKVTKHPSKDKESDLLMMGIQPGYIYIIPSNRDIILFDGTLQLTTLISPHGQYLPLNFFLRTLAQEKHKRTIAMVLSGTLGVKKREKGMLIGVTKDESVYASSTMERFLL